MAHIRIPLYRKTFNFSKAAKALSKEKKIKKFNTDKEKKGGNFLILT